jgi:hypothetical protein
MKVFEFGRMCIEADKDSLLYQMEFQQPNMRPFLSFKFL